MSAKKPEDEKISAVAPFGLRMLPELRKQVEDAATANGRSLNSEIIARLELSFLPSVQKAGNKELRFLEQVEAGRREMAELRAKLQELDDKLDRRAGSTEK